MRRLLVLLVLVVTAALLVGTASVPAEARTRAGRYARQAFTATNAERTDDGLKALRPDQCLRHAAVRQATLMAQGEQLFHQDLGRVLTDCGLTTAGENVAYGYPSGRSVVVDGWMGSAGHRANILNPRFQLMGIGARKGHNGRWYVAQVFGAKG
jgi:uncharacterized protein YkwD